MLTFDGETLNRHRAPDFLREDWPHRAARSKDGKADRSSRTVVAMTPR
jgi:hypothetical protein